MVRRQPPTSSARVASTRSLRGYDRPACGTRQAPIWRNSHGVGPRLVHGRLCPWLPVASSNPLAKDNTNRPAPPCVAPAVPMVLFPSRHPHYGSPSSQ